ncbi:MAG: hypothetical protein ACYTGL_23400 [Planctomycetota bacterium]|jgi:hypothetical protein
MAKKKTVRKKATSRTTKRKAAAKKVTGRKTAVKKTAQKKATKRKAVSRKAAKKATSQKAAASKKASQRAAAGAKLGRARITGDAKLDEFFKRDYEARQVFEFLRVHTVKELEQYAPDEIVERLTGPMLRTIDRIRKALALNNRSLKGDERYAIEFLDAIGGKPRTRKAADRR